MSRFSYLLSGTRGQRPPSVPEVVESLREMEHMLTRKAEYFEQQIDRELNTAKENARTNKRVALQALRRKHRLEKQLHQVDGIVCTLEAQREALEAASTNTAILIVMRRAAEALAEAHRQADIDRIHDIMDQVAESSQQVADISSALAMPLDDHIDDDELERELEEMEQAELDSKLVDTEVPQSAESTLIQLPEGPPFGDDEDEEDEQQIQQLQNWLI